MPRMQTDVCEVTGSTLTGRPSTIAITVCASAISHLVQKLSTSPPTLTMGGAV